MSSFKADVLKSKAKFVRQFLKQEQNIELSHSQCLELVSKLSGYKDWNNASAESKSSKDDISKPVRIRTVGGMKKALAPYPDSARLDAFDNLVIQDFIKTMAELNITEGALNSEYSFILADDSTADQVTLLLKLEHEDIGPWDNSIPVAIDWDWERDSEVR